MKINHYYKLDIKQHKFRLQYLKYQIHLTFVETMEINGGIFIFIYKLSSYSIHFVPFVNMSFR